MGEEVKKECRNFYFIPPSLIIAQMIIESNFGLSRIAVDGNNLFCHKFRGQKLGFLVAADDSPTDRFTKFRSQWSSLRAHSYLLMNKYSKRIKFKSQTRAASLNDWFCALCGGKNAKESLEFVRNGGTVYATACLHEVTYSERLKRVIKSHDLRRFDR